jgi:hypothetical protein
LSERRRIWHCQRRKTVRHLWKNHKIITFVIYHSFIKVRMQRQESMLMKMVPLLMVLLGSTKSESGKTTLFLDKPK